MSVLTKKYRRLMERREIIKKSGNSMEERELTEKIDEVRRAMLPEELEEIENKTK